MPETVLSKNAIPVRLTDTQWAHVLEGHPELTGMRSDVHDAVQSAERVLQGGDGELLAVKEWEPGKWLVVAYRELNNDGFIITAFLTSKERSLQRRRQLWP